MGSHIVVVEGSNLGREGILHMALVMVDMQGMPLGGGGKADGVCVREVDCDCELVLHHHHCHAPCHDHHDHVCL